MTRISVSLDAPTAEALKRAAGGGGNVSGWVADLIREKLLTAAATAAAEFDRHADHDVWETDRLAGKA